jgi:hypothetical protein
MSTTILYIKYILYLYKDYSQKEFVVFYNTFYFWRNKTFYVVDRIHKTLFSPYLENDPNKLEWYRPSGYKGLPEANVLNLLFQFVSLEEK